MPAESAPLALRAGQIVLADWRGDVLPKEPNKRRPAVVIEDDGLFSVAYPNAILVPLTEDANLAIPISPARLSQRLRTDAASHAGPSRIWSRQPRSYGCERHLRASLPHNLPRFGGRLPSRSV